jgi:hypothetical protein
MLTTLTRLQSVPFPRLMPFLQSVPLPNIVPPLQEVREAVERDMRGLWAGMDALRLQELPAANDETVAPEPVAAPPARAFRPPLGWISLAVAAGFFAALGFAQVQIQHHLSPTEQQQPHKARAATRKHKKLRRILRPERTNYSRTDYSRGT